MAIFLAAEIVGNGYGFILPLAMVSLTSYLEDNLDRRQLFQRPLNGRVHHQTAQASQGRPRYRNHQYPRLVTDNQSLLLGVEGEFADFVHRYLLAAFSFHKKDGFTLASEIRNVNSEIPIVFLTAKSLKDDIFEGFKIGADDYITKPFSMEELVFRASVKPSFFGIMTSRTQMSYFPLRKALYPLSPSTKRSAL